MEEDPLGKPVDLGTDFYAVLINVSAWKHLHYEDNGNVDLRAAQDNTRQIWKFERQNDLSYKIISTYDGKLLDVVGAGKTNGTSVQTYVDHGISAQQWFFYGSSGHYYLRAKHSNLVLDLNENNHNDGANIQMWEYNGGDAQIFQVYRTEMNCPILNVSASTENDNTNLSWSSALGTNIYNVRIKCGNIDYSIWNVASTSCNTKLPVGTYTAYIDACNYTNIRKSNEVIFNVTEDTSKLKLTNEISEYSESYHINSKIANLTQSAVYAAALYASDGRMLDIQTVSLSGGETSASAALSKRADASYIKVFLWDDLESMQPLYDYERLSI